VAFLSGRAPGMSEVCLSNVDDEEQHPWTAPHSAPPAAGSVQQRI